MLLYHEMHDRGRKIIRVELQEGEEMTGESRIEVEVKRQ
jgi:hypothetical protein